MSSALVNSPATAHVSLSDLFTAYYSCRQNKRTTTNALKFELDYEANLYKLWQEITAGTYRPGRSLAFIIDRPVKREIFAADFRDRIVHHLLINKFGQLLEREFIYDSYACREGKGTHFGIVRVQRFIRQCSVNYTRDCYVLKLDISGFFMHIDRQLLRRRLRVFLEQRYHELDAQQLFTLLDKVVYNDPARNCTIKGSKSDWRGLPKSKSLFYSPEGCGLPIGNLTSQVFANFYMNSFDHFVKSALGVRYYGRYVDDFLIVHQDRDYLASLLPHIEAFLYTELGLRLHPDKIYLEHYGRGVPFLGVCIKPHRTYAGARIKGNFYATIQRYNRLIADHTPSREEQHSLLSSLNSYLGLLIHYDTYRLRRKMLLAYLNANWWNYAHISGGYAKLKLRQRPVRKSLNQRGFRNLTQTRYIS